MEGYSVTEAASVLGVPTERVWELLARGVLSGAPEGETGMRVYLQPRPAPSSVEAKGPNGDGGTREPERELSPFRELLTEFRNLTERYGQALLALGEARGEVAALRSRVDLLEARMDLRLPMGPPQPAAWSSSPTPLPVERAVMPAAPIEKSEDAEPSEEEERRARVRGPRRATESFAEALARAEDPSPSELPGGIEAAAALAALRQQADAGSDIGLPRDVAGADEIPVAEAVETVGAGSEPVAEGHPTFEPAEEPVPLERAEATDVEASAAAEPVQPEAEAEAEAEAEPVAEAEAESRAEPETAARVEGAPEEFEGEAARSEPGPGAEDLEPETEAQAEPETEAQTEPETEAQADLEPPAVEEPEPVAAEVEPIEWDAERYTTDIEEPDWFAAEVIEADQERAVIDEPEPEPEPPVDQVESVDANHPAEAISATETVNPVEYVGPTSVPDEVAGADEMEVAPTGTQHEGTTTGTAPPPHTARAFPGADDLDAAIAALRAAGRSSEALPPADRLHRSEPAEAETEPEWPPRSTFTRPPTTTGAATRGPASRAYRRLRRIFPG